MNNVPLGFTDWKWRNTVEHPHPPIPTEYFMSCFSPQELTKLQLVSKAALFSMQEEMARRNSFCAHYETNHDQTRFRIIGSDESLQKIVTEFYNNLPICPVQERLFLFYPYPNRLPFASINVHSGQETDRSQDHSWEAWENPEKVFVMNLSPTTTVYSGKKVRNQYFSSGKETTISHRHWSAGYSRPRKHIIKTKISCLIPYQFNQKLSENIQKCTDIWERNKSSIQLHLRDFISCLDPEIRDIPAIQNMMETLCSILQQEPFVAFRILTSAFFVSMDSACLLLPDLLQIIEKSLHDPYFRTAIRLGSRSAMPWFKNETAQEYFENCSKALLEALAHRNLLKLEITVRAVDPLKLEDPLLQRLWDALIPLFKECKELITQDPKISRLLSNDPAVKRQVQADLQEMMGRTLQPPHFEQIKTLCRTAAAQRAVETVQTLPPIQRKMIPMIEIIEKNPSCIRCIKLSLCAGLMLVPSVVSIALFYGK